MTHTLIEDLAHIIQARDNQRAPDGYADSIGIEDPNISDWGAFLAAGVADVLLAERRQAADRLSTLEAENARLKEAALMAFLPLSDIEACGECLTDDAETAAAKLADVLGLDDDDKREDAVERARALMPQGGAHVAA